MKIGIFGGSFDPIHNGHLMLANQAMNDLKLDEIIFIPCGQSPYKDKQIVAPPRDRCLMLISAIKNNKNFHFHSYEVFKTKKTYTIDTIAFITDVFNGDFTLIVGPDGVETFDSWKNSKGIKKLVKVAFAKKDFYCPDIAIRSTLIRDMVKKGKSIKYLVPDAVEKYIKEKGLYK